MLPKSMRIFVSCGAIRRAEEGTKGKTQGRPILHSTCLVLAMLGVRTVCGIGYRETERFFAERGFTKLPDFRTLQWRANYLNKIGIAIRTTTLDRKGELFVLVRLSRAGGRARCDKADAKRWRKLMHSLGNDFVELAL